MEKGPGCHTISSMEPHDVVACKKVWGKLFQRPDRIMEHLRQNVVFRYIYRDAGNYKQFGSVVFSNPNNLTIDELTKAIRAKLTDGEFFCPEKWKIPMIYAEPFDPELDHSWFEFREIEPTMDQPVDHRNIEQFLQEIG